MDRTFGRRRAFFPNITSNRIFFSHFSVDLSSHITSDHDFVIYYNLSKVGPVIGHGKSRGSAGVAGSSINDSLDGAIDSALNLCPLVMPTDFPIRGESQAFATGTVSRRAG